jgi:hypothetical protein
MYHVSLLLGCVRLGRLEKPDMLMTDRHKDILWCVIIWRKSKSALSCGRKWTKYALSINEVAKVYPMWVRIWPKCVESWVINYVAQVYPVVCKNIVKYTRACVGIWPRIPYLVQEYGQSIRRRVQEYRSMHYLV